MFVELGTIERFYTTPYGVGLHNAVLKSIFSNWANLFGCNVLGLGYSSPYLDKISQKGGKTLSLIPSRLGVQKWPMDDMNKQAQGELNFLPFPDASFEQVIMIHALEFDSNPEEALAEVWRTLCPGGRVIIVVPNRHGLLVRSNNTPFGRGMPYTESQLKQLLRKVKLTPLGWFGVGLLNSTPDGDQSWLNSYKGPMASGFLKKFSGVIVMEAEKQVFAGLKTSHEKVRIFKAQPAPI